MPDITEPGVYNLPAEAYHGDPVAGGSLSSTGARKLLPPGCPAAYAYWRMNPDPPNRTLSFGQAAHRVVLGEGADLVVVEADNYRTKAAQEAKKEAHAAGLTPLLTAEHDVVEAMAAAIRAHPIASKLLAPGSGVAEQTLVWRDGQVWRRALVDWLRHPRQGQRLIIPDYKTTTRADSESVQKTIATYGYHVQGAWYADGARALGLAEEVVFLLVMQEKDPPYLVNVVEPDPVAMRIGHRLCQNAVALYAACTETGRWPGYSDDVELVPLPAWLENRYREDITP